MSPMYPLQIKLVYFDVYGLAEISRIILNFAGAEFTVSLNDDFPLFVLVISIFIF